MQVYVDSAFINRDRGLILHVAYLDYKSVRTYSYIKRSGVYDNNQAELDAVLTFVPHYLRLYRHDLTHGGQDLVIRTDSQYAIDHAEKLGLFFVRLQHVPRMLNPVNQYVHLLVQEFRGKPDLQFSGIQTRRL